MMFKKFDGLTAATKYSIAIMFVGVLIVSVPIYKELNRTIKTDENKHTLDKCLDSAQDNYLANWKEACRKLAKAKKSFDPECKLYDDGPDLNDSLKMFKEECFRKAMLQPIIYDKQ